jgi:5-methylcytosine-specific restriction endonuclease McrA
MKSCSKCKIDKELTLFYKCSRNKSGYRSQCITCENEYKEANKDKRKEYDKLRGYNLEYKKEYYLKNREYILLQRKSTYENNRESKLEYQKEYQKNNRDKRNSYLVERRQNDPLFKLITNVRNLIYNSFYYNGYSKNSKTEELLGCSFEELKEYLESKFEPWMNWDNRGLYSGEFNYGWDIDHVIPLSSVSEESDIIKLNHYTNLQPLCSKINRDIKKDSLEYGII